MMGDRPMSWVQLNSPTDVKMNGEVKRKKKKTKPPNLNLMDPRNIIIEKRRHSVHGYPDNVSPPYSPGSPLSRESSGSSGTYSPSNSSPRAFAMDWQQQPKHRSLTPIPEMKLNSARNNGILREETIVLDETHPEFLRELSTHDFNVDDIRVIVGRNKIRIIGENKGNTNHNSNKIKPQEFHKVVDIPPHVNPLSIKVKKYPGKIVIKGFNDQSKQSWPGSNNNPHLSVEDSGKVRITLNIPKGYSSKHLRFKTVTKHYLIVTGSSGEEVSDCNSDESSEGFVEKFELPGEPDKYHISSKLLDKNTMLVEVPLSRRSRCNSM